MVINEFNDILATATLTYVRAMETGYQARTWLEDEDGNIIADTRDAQTWPAFYDLGWTKVELHAGRLRAWASEYDEWERADRIENLTEETAYRLNWDRQAVMNYFNFDAWETLPAYDTWDRVLDRIDDLERDEAGDFDEAKIQTIISEEMSEVSGQDVKDMRLALGLSQDDLAGMLGVKQPTIARWEQGERSVPRGIRTELGIIFGRFMVDLKRRDTSGPWGPVVRFWTPWGPVVRFWAGRASSGGVDEADKAWLAQFWAGRR